jgi:outer membrane lipoprotein LolB
MNLNLYSSALQTMTTETTQWVRVKRQQHRHLVQAFPKFCMITFILFVMQACATKSTLDDQALIQLNSNLAALDNWKLKGRIAWITSSDRKSAYVNWQQRGQEMEFKLTNLLGINLATLNYNNTLATLQADGKTYSDPSASYLIYQITGWDVPILPLGSWIKGAASTDGREYYGLANNFNLQDKTNNTKLTAPKRQLITRFENGLIKQLIPKCSGCDAWQIDYQDYQNATLNNINYQLPTNISLTNIRTQAIIKIRVSEWSM